MRTSATLAALCASSVLAVPALDKRWAFGAAGYDAESTDNVPGAQCVRKTYPISVTAEISVFSNVDSNANETVLAALRQEFVSALPSYSNFTNQYLSSGKTANKSGTYDISGILCTPNDRKGKSANAIQLLLHGIGFDSSYWNFGGQGGVPSSYSYAAAAAAAGYTTFRYDRLGTGRSEHPADAYNTVQAANDVQILVKIAAGLKDGSLTGTAYSSITGIGHSYGSVQMNALTQISPNTLDNVILTGFSANTSAVPLYLTSTAYSTATEVAPSRFGDSGLTNAYLITLAPQTNQLNFFYYPYFTNEAFALARATEQPVTNGVLYTFGAVPGPAPSFKGNVYVVTGAKDFIFCYTNCYAVPQGSNRASILDYVSDLYPSAAKFNTYIPANTGHGIAGHTSAPSVNAQITSYLEGIGFGSS